MNQLVKVDRVKQLYFKNSYPFNLCYGGGSKTLYFDFAALDYVKSISFVGATDDYGSVVLNGVTIFNQSAQYGYSHCYDYVSGTIPVSYLKKKQNSITLSAYDGCWSNPDNATVAFITLYFNY